MNIKFKIIKYSTENNELGIDKIMKYLNSNTTLIETKIIDFYLGLMNSEKAISRVKFYLENGTQIQRNYSTLFLARKNIWKPINKAYRNGLIDYKQAYSR